MKTCLIISISLSQLFFSLASCGKKTATSDDLLKTKKQGYIGNNLKLSGYYYFKSGDRILNSYVLYYNGVLLNSGAAGDNPNTLLFLENNFISSAYIQAEKEHKPSWGVFVVDGNKIIIEHWISGEGPLKSYIKEGSIINDSTFKITSASRQDGSESINLEELYSFKKFSPKPDSVNKFIK